VLDQVVLPGLAAARQDLERGLISPSQAAQVAGAARDVAIEWLQDHEGAPESRGPSPGPTVACLPVADAIDEAAGAILAWLIQREGLTASVVPAALLFSERIGAAQAPAVGLTVCSSFASEPGPFVRRTLRALQRRSGHVVLALWLGGAEAPEGVAVVRTMAEALSAVRAAVAPARPDEHAVTSARTDQ
jgi:hypothetical protein